MKKQIDWLEIKSGEEFKGICNKILYWEVSKDAIPFGAKGRDKGTDGQYQGTYNDKTGDWRFQYKYHDPTMDKSRARSLVKSEYKNELEKIKNENPDYWVFMTNVKLTKTIHDEMMVHASKYNFEVHIWDGEKLESILPKYPFIIAYHFGYDLPLFEPYQEKFKDELKGKRPVINHNYIFQGRNQQIRHVKKLLSDEKCKLLLIAGSSGIGKTRLSIEAAKAIEKDKKWTPLFVRIEADKFDEHLSELSAQENYVIILDDAESYQHVNKLINLANREGWSEKLKLIIITKPQNIDDIKKYVYPQYVKQNVIESTIKKLSNKETLKLLADAGIKEDIDQRRLFPICKDSPILTIMAAKLFLDGILPEKMSQEEIITTSLNTSIDNLKKQGKLNHLKFLEILSAISPIGLRDEAIHLRIAEVMKIQPDEEKEIIQDLIAEGLIATRGGKLRVIPGMLADHVLHQKCFEDSGQPTGFHSQLIQEFLKTNSKQLINNLAAIEFKSVAGKNLLSDFAEEIIREIPKANNIQRLNILEVLDDFSYYRPLDALEIIGQVLKKPQPDVKAKDKLFGELTITNEMVKDQLPSLLEKTAYTLEALPTSLKLLKGIALKEDKKYLMGKSAYEKLKEICKFVYGRDVWISEEKKLFFYNEEWHEAMLKTFCEWLKEDNEKAHELALELMENLFKLECNYSRTSLENRAQFIFSKIRISRTKNLNRFRDKLLSIVFNKSEKAKYIPVRVISYGLLGKALRENINQDRFQKGQQKKDSEKEKEKIITFLEKSIKKESNLRILNNIERSIHYLIQVKDKNKQRAETIIKEIGKKPEYKLYKYLVGQHTEWDTIGEPDFWKNLTKQYTQKYTPSKICELLIRILEEAEQGWFFGTIGTFMREIGEQKPGYGRKLLEKILKEKNRLLEYAGYLLTGIRLKKKEVAIKYIKRLKDHDDIKIKKIVADSYERMRGYKDFTKEDMKILMELSTIDDETLKIKIADVLPNLYQVNEKDYLEILKNVSEKPTILIAGKLSDAIVRPDIKFAKQDFKIIKQIAGNFSDIDDLDQNNSAFYSIERLFRKIVEKDPEWIIDFFQKRVQQTDEQKKENQNYDAIPYSLHQTFKDIKNQEKYKDVLRRVRDWTLKKGWFLFEAPKLLKNLCTAEAHQTYTYLNQEISEVLMEWVESNEKEKMRNVAHILREITEDEKFYYLVRELIIKSDGDHEVLRELSASIFSSGGGVTKKTPGKPSQKLTDRVEYLKKLRDTCDNIKVKRFAEKQIESAKNQIRQELEWDEDLVD